MVAKNQPPLGKPANCQRVNPVFLGVNPLRKALRRVRRLYRNYCLYDQRPAIEFLGDKVHAAAVLRIAGLKGPLVGV